MAVAFSVAVSLSAPLYAADTEIKPELKAATYGFWLREEQNGNGLDKGLAMLLTPSLSINISDKNLTSALFYKNESVWYDDAQRSHNSLEQYSWNNVLSGFDERVRLALTAESQHQIRNSQQGVFSDIITGAENLAKNRKHGAKLDFSTRRNATVSAKLSFSYTDLRSEVPEADDSLGDFNNTFSDVSLSLGTTRRQSPFFWQLKGNYSRTVRDIGGDFVNRRLSGIMGTPLLPGVSIVNRGSHEKAANLVGLASEFSSLGTGLEWQFGRVSRINFTRNWSERTFSGPVVEEVIDEEYTAVEVYLAPTRRTSLSYISDRRYYGRSTEISGQYNLRFLTMRLSVTDGVDTQSFFEQTTEDLGIFVCPSASAEFEDCFRPPSSNYQLGVGETLQQWVYNGVELSENLVKRYSESLNIGYNKNRLTLNVQLSSSEDKYLETDRINERKSVALQSVWRLTEQADLSFTARGYEIDYRDEQRKDKNSSVELGVKTQLNAHSDISFSLRRMRRNSNVNSFDVEESRVWLTYSYRL
uniref:Glycine-rich cell wall structural protein n=1 Tax=Rheinheimera sp. BAL341 TaxID=1708203 RepID=A0A486XTE2_9GAMM